MNNFPQQAIIPFTISLTHAALLVYMFVRHAYRNNVGFKALVGYLSITTVWNLLWFAEIMGFAERYLSFTWPWLTFYLMVMVSLSILYFTYQFLEKEQIPWLATGTGIVALGILVAFEFEVVEVSLALFTVQVFDGWPFLIRLDNPMMFHLVVALSIFLFLGLAVLATLQAVRQTYSPRHRNRIQILLMSQGFLSFGLLLFLTRYPVLRDMGLVFQWIGAPILIGIVLKQNLPHISTGFKELVNFSIVTFVTLVFYGLIVYGLQTLLAGFANTEIIVAGVAAVLLALFYLPLRRLTVNLIEYILFGYRYNDEQIIKDYIQTTNTIMSLQELVTVSLEFIEQNLNIKRGAFFLLSTADKEHYYFEILSNLGQDLPKRLGLRKQSVLMYELIDRSRSVAQYNLDLYPEFKKQEPEGSVILKEMAFEQYVPIRRTHNLVGVIALGSFASGAPYTLRDIDLFSTLATQVAIALENARLFDNVRRNLEEITQIKDVMSNIFSSIESSVITVDNANRILMINQAAYSILNLSENIGLGSDISEIMQGLNNTALPALYRDVKTTQRNYHNYEVTAQVPDRGQINLSVDMTPLRNSLDQVEGVAIVINDMTEKSRLQATQDMFRTYLSPAVVDRLPSDPTQLRLGGQRQEVSILFADIRGFTTFSENLPPEDLITVLNEYLSIAAEEILVFEGTLDKFMGDAVMAIFNAPLSQPDHPLRAVKAAAAMQKRLEKYQQRMGDKVSSLQFGVGIHVGEAVVGNVGTTSRMDYTAIGDAVNLAKRIQENTPGGKILLSQHTYNLVQQYIEAVPYADLTVKGRRESESTYELLNIYSDQDKSMLEVEPIRIMKHVQDYCPSP